MAKKYIFKFPEKTMEVIRRFDGKEHSISRATLIANAAKKNYADVAYSVIGGEQVMEVICQSEEYRLLFHLVCGGFEHTIEET